MASWSSGTIPRKSKAIKFLCTSTFKPLFDCCYFLPDYSLFRSWLSLLAWTACQKVVPNISTRGRYLLLFFHWDVLNFLFDYMLLLEFNLLLRLKLKTFCHSFGTTPIYSVKTSLCIFQTAFCFFPPSVLLMFGFVLYMYIYWCICIILSWFSYLEQCTAIRHIQNCEC